MSFINLHPSETAGKGQRIGFTSRYKCKQCGFPVDANQRSNKSIENLTDGLKITGTGNDVEISSDAGCPHCGSFNWSSKVVRQNRRRSNQNPNFRASRLYAKRF